MTDYLEEELSALDGIEEPNVKCPYEVGASVLLRQPERQQKRKPPFQQGWKVVEVISPSTVWIESTTSTGARKMVNVDLLKPAPTPVVAEAPSRYQRLPSDDHPSDDDDEEESDVDTVVSFYPGNEVAPPPEGRYQLRDRNQLRCPGRFR